MSVVTGAVLPLGTDLNRHGDQKWTEEGARAKRELANSAAVTAPSKGTNGHAETERERKRCCF